MQLSILDWAIVLVILSSTMVIGFVVSKRAAKSSASFFLAGQSMPWWLLGVSMVATTFAADTPNLVTDIVRSQGVSGNWVWWAMLLTGMLTTFVYAKLWRRLGITTDVEFYEHRYTGKPARFLRGFRALYLGIFFNVMIMANVTLAAVKIGSVLFGIDPTMVIIFACLITVIFSTLGGFLGVLITDLILFVIAMVGSVTAAYFAVSHPAVGGVENLLSHPAVVDKLAFAPDFSNPEMYMPLLIIPLLVQWWSVWYPGSEPGGGGYIAQRMLAAKNENHAVAASAFFNLCHYAVRPWPWIIVALASIIVYPDLASLQQAFPNVPEHLVKDDLAYSAMLTFLPAGVLGLVVASLVSAYVSTISTSLNWGASYFVNDFYARFIKQDASDKQQVFVGRVATVLLMVCASLMALVLENALQGFRLLMTIGAGTGLLFLLRWFWGRINAWSEISAMVFSFFFSMLFEFGPFEELVGWQKMLLSVGLTTAAWIIVTLVTQPESEQTLNTFWQRIQFSREELTKGLVIAAIATIGTYSALFATGAWFYQDWLFAMGMGVVAVVSGFVTYKYGIRVE
ncbi:sodium:solute symporter family protein (plasmid) [Catenovulum sp. SX2]|uniref:sodium:solute symporter family protein n=1 Tax=Catenovulum sp. SX2 TaxID=3398614 RepID=UPI003F880033